MTGGTPIGRLVVGLEGTELLVTVLAGKGPRVVGGEAGVVVVPVPEVFSVDPPIENVKLMFVKMFMLLNISLKVLLSIFYGKYPNSLFVKRSIFFNLSVKLT